MEVRIRPKSDYMHTANWEQLYALAEHWKSDMDFYKDEVRFLKDLIDRYFIWLVEDANINKIRDLVNKLRGVDRQQQKIASAITKHMKHLRDLMQNAFVHDEQKFREEHADLEDMMASYIKEFIALKRDIFRTTEQVIETEKLQRLLAR